MSMPFYYLKRDVILGLYPISMKVFLWCSALLLCSCQKPFDQLFQNPMPVKQTSAKTFTRFVIPKNAHYATGSKYEPFSAKQLSFMVRFDSSAIYTTGKEENQYDINKLYGFSDNNSEHHKYSARFGWRWSDGALRLFAYVYNDGVRTAEEITTAVIGEDVACSIAVSGGQYIFTCNGKTITMPRKSTTAAASGYQLYPYFGGDETAPHDISIWIKEA